MAKFLNSDIAAFLLLVSTLDLFALTPIFLGRVDVHRLSFAAALGWALFGTASVVGVLFLCFCMGWHCCKMRSNKRATNKLLFLLAGCSPWGSAAYYYCVYLPCFFSGSSEQVRSSMRQASVYLPTSISKVDCDGIHWRVYRFTRLDQN